MKIPAIPNDAKHDGLPGGGDKSAKYRGTLAWWVMSALLSAVIITGGGWISSLKGQIKDCEASAEKDAEKKDLIIAAQNKRLEEQMEKMERVLAYGVSGLEQVKNKTQTLQGVVEQNAQTYNLTEKTLKDEARKN